ncbi:hypothetical protein ES703_120534 [subsurface metagenome]
MKEKTVWGIHGGPEWEADDLFRKKNIIAIGWHEMGDLSKEKDREEYKEKYPKVYKDASDGAIRNAAGIFYRFVYEMKIGDLAIYPSMPTRQIYIGKILGPYRYAPNLDSLFPNQRDVHWLKHLPRTHFSQQALYEIGSALALFQVRNNSDEFITALEGKREPLVVEEEIATITADIETQTRDFILKQLYKRYKGEALEGFVIHLLEKMGYHARRTTRNKPSIDIIAHKDEFGFESPLIKCQVKSEEGAIKLEPIEKLCSRVKSNEYGLFITLSSFNDKVYRFAETQPNLRLIAGYELVNIILEHYDELDTKYKNTIPLNKVFLPSVTK